MEEQTSAPRRAPASGVPNNQDVFVWALFQLGGAEHDVDVEAIFLRSFDLAPARLGWRTRPDLPDYKKAAKALQSVESKTHVGLVHRTSPYLRRLTTAGTVWVEQNRSILERRQGCWERIDDERADLLDDVPWLADGDSEQVGPHVATQAVARFDAAELAGVRLPVATLLGGEENERGSNE